MAICLTLKSCCSAQPTLLPKAGPSVPRPLPPPSSPLGKEVAKLPRQVPFSSWTNTCSSWFSPYMKWVVSILSSSSKQFYLFQLGKVHEVGHSVPIICSGLVVKCKISLWVWSTQWHFSNYELWTQGSGRISFTGSRSNTDSLVKSYPGLPPLTLNLSPILLFPWSSVVGLHFPLPLYSHHLSPFPIVLHFSVFLFPLTTRSS